MPAPQNFTLNDVTIKAKDLSEEEIEHIYAKMRPSYAVYRTASKVVIMYSDDPTIAAEQRARIVPLNVLRSEVTALIDGWRTSKLPANHARARRYDTRVAAALIVALDGDSQAGATALTELKNEIIDQRTSAGRFDQLTAGFTLLVAVTALVGVLCLTLAAGTSLPWVDMALAGSAGALGAFFSLALGIRGRTVLPNLIRRDNILDAGLRVTIGIIAAIVLYLLLHSGLVTIAIGNAQISGPALNEELAVVIAFAAGFLEMLVPDLLAKTTATGETAAAASPLSSGAQPVLGGDEPPPPPPGPPTTSALAPPSMRPPSPDPRSAVG